MIQEEYDNLPSELRDKFSYQDIYDLIFVGGPNVEIIKKFSKKMFECQDFTVKECVAVLRISIARILVLEKGASNIKELEQRFKERYYFANNLIQGYSKKITEELGKAVEKQKC